MIRVERTRTLSPMPPAMRVPSAFLRTELTPALRWARRGRLPDRAHERSSANTLCTVLVASVTPTANIFPDRSDGASVI